MFLQWQSFREYLCDMVGWGFLINVFKIKSSKIMHTCNKPYDGSSKRFSKD